MGHREEWVFFRSPPPPPPIKCLFNTSLPNFNPTITLNLEGKCPLHFSVLRTCMCPMLLFSLIPPPPLILHCGSVCQSTLLIGQAQLKQALLRIFLLRGLPRILESSLFRSRFKLDPWMAVADCLGCRDRANLARTELRPRRTHWVDLGGLLISNTWQTHASEP